MNNNFLERKIKDLIGICNLFLPEIDDNSDQKQIEWQSDFRSHLSNLISATVSEYKEELLSKMPNIIEMPVDFENEARKLPREQIFMAGQLNMLMRLNKIIKEL